MTKRKKNPKAMKWGAKGGRRLLAVHGKEYFSKIAKKRWDAVRKAKAIARTK